MKALAKRIYANQHYSKVAEWGRLISIAGSAQVLVQAIGFACGIIIIRLLSFEEYAIYTLANTMLGTMTVLADGGITTGALSLAGKVWQDPKKLGAVMATGIALRKRFAIISLVIATPILVFLLWRHDAGWLTTLLVTLSLVPAFYAALSDNILEIAPRIRQDIVPLQKNQVAANLMRLALLVSSIFFLPYAFIAILGSGISRTWANFKLRKISSNYADASQPRDAEMESKILTAVKRIFPVSLYYCFSSQATIWIISLAGTTTTLGKVGALNGLTTALNIFTVLFSVLVVPRFARLQDDKHMIKKRFWQVQLGLFLLSALIITVISLFSSNILWLLGDRFSSLSTELVLVAASSCAALISSSTNQLLSSRGIIVPPFIFIATSLAAQVALAFVLRLNETSGAILYGLYSSLIIYTIRLIYLFIRLRRYEINQ